MTKPKASDNGLLAELGAQTFRDSFAADNTPENMAAYLAASSSPTKQAAEQHDLLLQRPVKLPKQDAG